MSAPAFPADLDLGPWTDVTPATASARILTFRGDTLALQPDGDEWTVARFTSTESPRLGGCTPPELSALLARLARLAP